MNSPIPQQSLRTKIADFIIENYFTENGFARDYDEALKDADAICAVFAEEIKKLKTMKFYESDGSLTQFINLDDLLTTLEEGK